VSTIKAKLDVEERCRLALETELQLLQDSERSWKNKYSIIELQVDKTKQEKDDLNRKIRESSFKLSFRSL